MMKKSKILFLVALFCGSNLSASFSSSAESPRPMKMSFADVLKLYGAPEERDEHETARIVIWKYPFGKVVFHDGVYVLPAEKGYSENISSPVLESSKETMAAPSKTLTKSIGNGDTRKIIVQNQR